MSRPPAADLKPTLVRGVTAVADADGVLHLAKRPLVAVCNCGLSRIAPWCDNTHKMVTGSRATAGDDDREDG